MNTILPILNFEELSKEKYQKGIYRVSKIDSLVLFRYEEIIGRHDKRECNYSWGKREFTIIRNRFKKDDKIEYMGRQYSDVGSDPAPEDTFKFDNKIWYGWSHKDTFECLEKCN